MIVIATQNFAPDVGGMQAYLTGLAESFSARGHAVAVFCDKPHQHIGGEQDAQRPYAVTRFGGLPVLRRWLRSAAVNRHVQAHDCDAVIADSWKSIEQLPAALTSRVRVICLAHGAELLARMHTPKAGRIERAFAKASLVAANSAYTASLVNRFTGDVAKIKTVWPGVEAPAGASADAPISRPAKARLISIARLDPYKGIDTVLQAIPTLRRQFPDLRYDVVGDGKDRNRLREICRELGIDAHVVFHGKVSEKQKADLLRQASVFLLPNRREPGEVEGFGLVFSEAGAFGLPCIGGNSGGVPDAVTHGQNGLLVNGRQVDEVVQAVQRLLSDAAYAAALGAAGHRRFWTQMYWPVAIGRFEALLRS